MSVPGRCSVCDRAVLQTWHLDGTDTEVCLTCLALDVKEALTLDLDVPPPLMSVDDIIRRLRP